MARPIRPPVHLPRHRARGAIVCVMAQLEHVLRLTRWVQPRPDVIDRKYGISDGSITADVDADSYHRLLTAGLRCVSYALLDPVLLIEQGKLGIMKVYGGKWTATLDAYFTLSRVRQLQAGARKEMSRLRRFVAKNKMQIIARQATREDVIGLLRDGWIVIVAVNDRSPGQFYSSMLLVPHEEYPDGSKVWLYSPRESGQTVWQLSVDRVLDSMRCDWTIRGVKR